MGQIEERIKELGIELPTPAVPAGSYLPFVLSGSQLWVAGQVPFWDGKIKYRGKVHDGSNIKDAVASARLCALNIIAQAKAALGNLDRIERFIKLGGFVNAVPEFTDHPIVINGASDIITEIFGDAGRHARFAVGANGLPLNSTTEVDAIIAVRA